MSIRTERIVIRVSKDEREAILRMAESEHLAESTCARQVLLKRAEEIAAREGKKE